MDVFEFGNEAQSVESGFRGVFRGFGGLEEMIRTCRYPRIMVQPIAISKPTFSFTPCSAWMPNLGLALDNSIKESIIRREGEPSRPEHITTPASAAPRAMA